MSACGGARCQGREGDVDVAAGTLLDPKLSGSTLVPQMLFLLRFEMDPGGEE